MHLRRLLNNRWVGLPLLFIGFAFLGKRVYPFWQARTEEFRGASLGVIVTVSAGLLGYWLTRYFDRRVRRYNVLCHLEVTLNHLLTALSDNQFQLDRAIQSQQLTLIYPRSMPISRDDIQEVGHTDLKNKLLGVLIDFEKYAHDLAFMVSIVDRNVGDFKVFRARQSTDPQFVQSMLNDIHRQSREQLRQLHEYGKLVERSTHDALVDIRFFAKNDRPPLIGLGPFYSKRELKRWREKDSKQLAAEVAQTMAADHARRRSPNQTAT